MQNLVLGTANFGERYGIASTHALTTREVDQILTWSSGKILELDTSEDYKGSHSAIARHSVNFKITTKIDINHLGSPREIPLRVKNACTELRTNQIERILLRPHSTNWKFTLKSITELEKLKELNVVREIGISIYETQELEHFTQVLNGPIVFQVPLNLLNRSFHEFINSNSDRYKRNKFYVRSIFLQGLLHLKPNEIPSRMSDAKEPILLLNQVLEKAGLSIIEATYAFIKRQDWVTGIIVGIQSLDELKRSYEIFRQEEAIDCRFLDTITSAPARVLDPRNW